MRRSDYPDYRIFTSSKAAHIWAEETYSALLSNKAFCEARNKIIEYTGNTYVPINTILRTAPEYGSEAFDKCALGDYEEYRTDIAILIHALNQFPLMENIVAYRAITWRALLELCKGLPKKGRIFRDKAFTSTSLTFASVEEFSKTHNCPCILKLFLPQGVLGAFVSNYDEHDLLDENEFLIMPNLNFEIVSVHPFSRTHKVICRGMPQHR